MKSLAVYKSPFLAFSLVITLCCLLNFFARRFFFRMDFTQDQRYSIHQVTKDLLSQIEEEVCIKIYLAGDLPAGLQRLQHATKEMLEELNVYANHKLHYQWIDPHTMPKKKGFSTLAQKGIQPTNFRIQEKGKTIEKIIFPGALVSYGEKEVSVMLLKGNTMTSPAQMLNQSIENIEYAFATAIRKVVAPKRKKIGLVRGHAEPDTLLFQGLLHTLRQYYAIDYLDLSQQQPLAGYDAMLITKPQQPFLEIEKYNLDQYIMQGGKVLFFLNYMRIDMDSLRKARAFAFPVDLNLADQLFKYGVRINHDLIQDIQSGVYPIVIGNLGNQPHLKLLPWPFFPILNHFSKHLIVKNLDALYAQFISSIDTVKATGVVKTPLVFTSPYTRKQGAPILVDLEALRRAPQPKLYTHGPQPVAYLLEGTFTSLYQHKPIPTHAKSCLTTSKPTKVFITTSSNLLLNILNPRTRQPFPWGYDPFLQRNFAHKDFLHNTLAYMLEEHGLINASNKTFTIRLLDKVKVAQQRTQWQLMNLAIPLIVLLLLGLIWHYYYKKKYTLCRTER